MRGRSGGRICLLLAAVAAWVGAPGEVPAASSPTLLAHVSGDGVVDGLYRIEVRTGERVERLARGRTRFALPSPDRRLIVFGTGFANGLELWTVRPDGSDRTRLTDNDMMDAAPSWSPDSEWLVFERRDVYGNDAALWIVTADGSTERRLSASDDSREFAPDWSVQNVIAFQQDDAVYVVAPDGGERRRLTTGSGPLWSPDGSRLLVQRGICTACDGSDQRRALFSVAADGSEEILLVRTKHSFSSYTWSPDEQRVAFSVAGRQTWLGVVDAGGQNRRRLVEGLSHFDAQPSWSPSTSWIAFTKSSRRGAPDFWRVRPDGSGVRPVTATRRVGEIQPTWGSFPFSEVN
ncbi:MAG TPA: hypothetical protein VM573_06540 [Actinomycetota bacterium]|nr:hypothetical protein [Actinomycetota bacterium]